MATLLADGYNRVDESAAKNGDILVFKDKKGNVIHSSTLTNAQLNAGKLDAANSEVLTKNGKTPQSKETVGRQMEIYGPSSRFMGTYQVYRPK